MNNIETRKYMTNLPHFYIPNQEVDFDQNLTLDAEKSHYLLKVLRLSISDKCILFNELGDIFLGKIFATKRTLAHIRISKKLKISQKQSPSINLALALFKRDRMEWALQKATELGVKNIFLLKTQNSIINVSHFHEKRYLTRLKKIVIHASEQSRRMSLPTIHHPVHFNDFIKQKILEQWTPIVLDTSAESRDQSVLRVNWRAIKKRSVLLFIGPEGDFSEQEYTELYQTQIAQEKMLSMSLGSEILRVETAVVSAMSFIRCIQILPIGQDKQA